ncbi:acyltransferase family protein [Cronobacter dublinensis]
MEPKNELHGLTIFRFVAAFYVFIFHCNIRYGVDFREYLGDNINELMSKFIKNGAVGMSFFFVLSGFVLAYASRDGLRKDYFRARIARIYPAYITLGIITLPFIFIYDLQHIMAYMTLFLSTTQSWFAGSFTAWNFSGSWSISTEMFFYLTFPFLLPVVKRNPYISLAIALIATSLISPISNLVDSKIGQPVYQIYISPIHRLPEFIAGVALGCMYIRGFRITRFRTLILLCAVISLLIFSPNGNIGWIRNNSITVPATCYLVYYFATANINASLISAPFIYLGRISYSFYLMQIPIMLYLVKYLPFLSQLPTLEKWVVLFMLNLVMASACYHFVENNNTIRKFIMRVGRRNSAATA